MECPGEELIGEFVRGSLAPAERTAIESHLDACADCQRVVVYLVRIFGSADSHTRGGEAGSQAPVDTMTGDGEPLRTVELAAGELVGRYRVLERVGSGGMGVVYAAYDPELDRKIALKVLRGAQDSVRNARLIREAQAMARLAHPNVITVHDVGNHRGRVFVAMEFVRGTTMAAWLHERRRSWLELRPVFVASAEGLAAAHAAGLVHRDFKPDNVLLGDDGRVRVTDFGLARSDGTQDHSGPTHRSGASLVESRTDALVGTPAYMAPEQYDRRPVDARTDQFAFCVALFEGLYGKRPFAGHTLAELAGAVVQGRMRAIPRDVDVPARVRRAVLKGLAVDPAERFASMDLLVRELSFRPTKTVRKAAVAVLPASIAAIGAGAWAVRHEPELPVGLCAADESLTRSYGTVEREAIRLAFEGTGLPYASEVSGRALQAVDEHVARWEGVRRELCQPSSDGADVASEGTAEAVVRASCLRQGRAHVEALLEAFAAADEAVVGHAPAAVEALPDPSRCLGPLADLGELIAPAPVAQRVEVAQHTETLARIDAMRTAGKYRPALELAERVRAAADDLGYRPLQAEALAQVARLHARLDTPNLAADELEEAAWLGVEARHRRVSADAWMELAFVRGVTLGDLEGGTAALRAARAEVEALGDAEAREKLLVHEGTLAIAAGRHAEAVELLGRALKGLEGRDAPLRAADVRLNLGGALVELGSLDEATRHFIAYISVQEQAFGPDHPEVALGRFNLGAVYYSLDRLSDAVTELETSAAIAARTLGSDSSLYADARGAAGAVLVDLGKLDLGIERLREAMEVFERRRDSTGDSPGLVERHRLNLAGALAEAGRVEEARELVATAERNLADPSLSDAPRLLLMGTKGEVARAERQFERALADFDRVVEASRQEFGAEHPMTWTYELERLQTLAAAGSTVEARQAAEALLRRMERGSGATSRAKREVQTLIDRATD